MNAAAVSAVGAVAAVAVAVSAAAAASPVPTVPDAPAAAPDARGTAAVGMHRYSVGVFNPLVFRLGSRAEIQAHPLLFLVAPNVVLRLAHRRGDGPGWSITGEYGLSFPTLAMRLSQGFLFPSWDRGGGQIGWTAAPRVGVVVSRGAYRPAQPSWKPWHPAEMNRTGVPTFLADITVGIPITHNDATPLDAPAPLDLLLAPVLTGMRVRAGAIWDQPIGSRLRARAYGDLYLHGRTPLAAQPDGVGWSNVTTRLGLGVDYAPGARRLNRITVGLAWWNSDQHAIDGATFEPIRTNEIWPTVDFIWAN